MDTAVLSLILLVLIVQAILTLVILLLVLDTKLRSVRSYRHAMSPDQWRTTRAAQRLPRRVRERVYTLLSRIDA